MFGSRNAMRDSIRDIFIRIELCEIASSGSGWEDSVRKITRLCSPLPPEVESPYVSRVQPWSLKPTYAISKSPNVQRRAGEGLASRYGREPLAVPTSLLCPTPLLIGVDTCPSGFPTFIFPLHDTLIRTLVTLWFPG